ncbi:MAG: hypothetical protein QM758_11010 [Armatimonas sp.]
MSIVLPPEYRFDVVKARKSLEALAENEPDAPILLTIAQIGDDGLEGESEMRTTALSAAALLETVTEDQNLKAGGRNLYVLRITQTEVLPMADLSE